MVQQNSPQSKAPAGDSPDPENAFNLLDDVNRQLEAVFGSADRVALVHDAFAGIVAPYKADVDQVIALFARRRELGIVDTQG
jgi:hypothetical protein